MAYENMTYEFILDRMMKRVTEKYPNLDNREGSIIFNALAPAALELAILYTEIDNSMNESFVATASREYLYEMCSQFGMDISVFEASAGVHKGEFNVEVPIGSRWNCELYNYTVTEFIGMHGNYYTYKMNCESVGTSPNNQTGTLTPITDSPDGLTYAMITECLVEGLKNVYLNDVIHEKKRADKKQYADRRQNDGKPLLLLHISFLGARYRGHTDAFFFALFRHNLSVPYLIRFLS